MTAFIATIANANDPSKHRAIFASTTDIDDALRDAIELCENDEFVVSVRQRDWSTPDLATVSFQPDAYDSAEAALRQVEDYTVKVVPVEGEAFDARLTGLVHDEHGETVACFAPWSETLGDVDPEASIVQLNIWHQLERIEVI